MKEFIKNLDWQTVVAAAIILLLLSPLVISAEEPTGMPVDEVVPVAVVCTSPHLFQEVLLEKDETKRAQIAVKQVKDGLCQPFETVMTAKAVEVIKLFYRKEDNILFTVYKLDPHPVLPRGR